MQRVIESVGGITALARRLQVPVSSIACWRDIPPRHVLAIESETGISRHELRPDVFGPKPEAAE